MIGLASLTTTEAPLPADGLELPEQLYEFFADEVYRSARAGESDRAGSARDRAEPRSGTRRRTARRRAGRARLRGGADLGVLEEREGRLEFHPLAAAFLEQQARRETTGDIATIVASVWRRIGGGWSGTRPLISWIRYGAAGDLETLFADALDELLNAAQTGDG